MANETMINRDMTIYEVLQLKPDSAQVFLDMGMHCLGCPVSRGEKVFEAAAAHQVDENELVAKLNSI